MNPLLCSSLTTIRTATSGSTTQDSLPVSADLSGTLRRLPYGSLHCGWLRCCPLLLIVVLASVACTPLCLAGDEPAEPAAVELDNRIAATVDGVPIYQRQIDRQIKLVLKDRPIDPEVKPMIDAQMLEQLVKRRLILGYLSANDLGVSAAEVSRAQQRVEKQLAAQDITLADYLARSGQLEDEFHDALRWQIGWKRYLDRYLTDENLEHYFDQHRRQFDGSELRVAHILIKRDATADATAWKAAEQRLREIRREIQSGKLSFADAAKKYSQATTGKAGGDIGFIARHQPMPAGFSRVAFALGKGEISQPVRSKFGAHLIQCLEIKPGEKKWADARRELEVAVTKYLFNWVAEQQRPAARIEFTQGTAHFRPGTTELAD